MKSPKNEARGMALVANAADAGTQYPPEILMAIFEAEVAGAECLFDKKKYALVCKQWNTQYSIWWKEYLEGANLFCAGSLQDAVDKLDLAGLTAGMHKYRLLGEVQRRGCEILLHVLTKFQQTRMRVRVGVSGLRAVHRALKNHPYNSDVCFYGMGALYQMCPENEVSNVVVVHESEMQRTVVEIMSIPRQKMNVLANGARFLFHWSPHAQTNVDKLQILFCVMKDNAGLERVQWCCLTSIHNTLHEAHRHGVVMVLEKTDFAAVTRTLHNHLYCETVMHFASLVMIELLWCVGGKEILLSLQADVLLAQVEDLYANRPDHVAHHAHHCRQLLVGSDA